MLRVRGASLPARILDTADRPSAQTLFVSASFICLIQLIENKHLTRMFDFLLSK